MLPVDLTEGTNNATYHALLYMMVMILGNVLEDCGAIHDL
jgi:hypothetical protein